MAEERSDEKLAKYRKRVKDGLDKAFAAAGQRDFDLDGERLVVFSDHHRGARDGADDFWRCERSYAAALGHYLELGYHLFLLGDVDELWENKPKEPLAAYPEIMALEAEFNAGRRLERFWGNHDDAWRHPDEVKKLLHPRFPGLGIREALRLNLESGGEKIGQLFLVHGHQGTMDSDRLSVFSRAFVRYGWRPIQRRFNIASTTPARDFELKANHDAAMFEWARARPERLVLVAGHTHRPVFGGTSPKPPVERELAVIEREFGALSGGTAEQRALLRAELELVRTKPFGEPPKEIWPPCYYNTGCCSFGDGDITGLELADGEIRLVRWLNDDYQAKHKLLAKEDIRKVLDAVSGRQLVPAG